MERSVLIRRASLPDVTRLVAFNQAMAAETEGKALEAQVLTAGVTTLLQTPALGFYLVAEQDGEVVAGLMVTQEWSDWRNGLFWWIQSVYVQPQCRRQGIYRKLYQFVKQLSLEENVCGFRLYVERDNQVAQQTYRSLGMTETVYRMFEQMNAHARHD